MYVVRYMLFIDESGESTPIRYKVSPLFILVGCSIASDRRVLVENYLNHIKFKYWGNTNVLFKSSDLGRKQKDFSIFKKDRNKFSEFVRDLEKCLLLSSFSLIAVVVDQKNACLSNWNQRAVLKYSYKQIFHNFVRMLIAQGCAGQILQEASSTIQDITIYENFFNIQSNGIRKDKISSDQVKSCLTSLSFVTKRNMDTESQLADLLAYGIKLDYLVNKKILTVSSLDEYGKMIRKCAKAKYFIIPSNLSTKKKLVYKNFKPIVLLP